MTQVKTTLTHKNVSLKSTVFLRNEQRLPEIFDHLTINLMHYFVYPAFQAVIYLQRLDTCSALRSFIYSQKLDTHK